MADFLKLFDDQRLSVNEPEHLEYIKGRLAALKLDDPSAYKKYSEFYGVEIEAKVTKEPVKVPVKPEKKKVSKKK